MKLIKYILYLTIALLVFACSHHHTAATDVDKDNLNGHVSMLKENSFKAVDSCGVVVEGVRGRKSNLGFDFTKRFNRGGYLEEYCEFESNAGNLTYKSHIVYDSDDNPIEQLSYSANDILESKSIYTLDADGNASKIQTFGSAEEKKAAYTYTYDDEGRVLLETCYRADGQFDWLKNYEYNRHGQVIEMIRDDSDNHFDCTYIYIYNKKHQLQEELVKDANHLFDKRYVFAYDKKGNRILEESYNSRAQLYSRLSFKYDKQGSKIERSELCPGFKGKSSYTYSYVYDKKGNWVRRVESYNGVAKFIVTREIAYHSFFVFLGNKEERKE